MNFTVTSKGRQFDRLGLMYLGDVEVFRTSTAEPTSNGIVWTYIKEMDQYETLWKMEQKIIFDLGNLIDSTNTAPFNTFLTATFFTVPNTKPAADQILPISARRSAENGPSAFSLPSDKAAVAHKLPQNVERAVVSLSACGQAAEEFWYTNVLNSEVDTFADEVGTLYGYSPFREVQLLIDGQLAGVSWPYPVIFTGGIVPGLWRPIVGIEAFDLREHEIEVTPWLPLLCDGASHTFEIRVVGINDDGNNVASLSETTGSSWIVTGKIFLFLGPNGSTTSGTLPRIDTPAPTLTISSTLTTNSTGANETLKYTTTASRFISVTSSIQTSNGTIYPASWTQNLNYKNTNTISAYGFTQLTEADTKGLDQSSSGYINDYEFHVTINSTFSITPHNTISINAALSRGTNYFLFGPSIFPSPLQAFLPGVANPRNLYLYARPQPYPFILPPNLPEFLGAHQFSSQQGGASYFSSSNGSRSTGVTTQLYAIKGCETRDEPDDGTELYVTNVGARNGSVFERSERVLGREVGGVPLFSVQEGEGSGLVTQGQPTQRSVREILGRGPGKVSESLVGTGGEREG
ncbi:MAG: hypothetical protein Q9166_003376 [cf. Caloplaca sp. 2 TL-2023]